MKSTLKQNSEFIFKFKLFLYKNKEKFITDNKQEIQEQNKLNRTSEQTI